MLLVCSVLLLLYMFKVMLGEVLSLQLSLELQPWKRVCDQKDIVRLTSTAHVRGCQGVPYCFGFSRVKEAIVHQLHDRHLGHAGV